MSRFKNFLRYNRRVVPRVPAQLAVQYKAGDRAGREYTTDLSETGLFIRTEDLPAVGTRAHLRLNVAERSLRIVGAVTRLATAAPVGFGLQFEGMTKSDQEFLQQYVGQRAEATANEQAGAFFQPVDSSRTRRPGTLARRGAAALPFARRGRFISLFEASRRALKVAIPVALIALMLLGLGQFIDSLQLSP